MCQPGFYYACDHVFCLMFLWQALWKVLRLMVPLLVHIEPTGHRIDHIAVTTKVNMRIEPKNNCTRGWIIIIVGTADPILLIIPIPIIIAWRIRAANYRPRSLGGMIVTSIPRIVSVCLRAGEHLRWSHMCLLGCNTISTLPCLRRGCSSGMHAARTRV